MIKYFFLTMIVALSFSGAAYSKDVHGHWNGQSYADNALLQSSWADDFFFKRHFFDGDELVLDVGSGDGKITAKIADQALFVLGIDKSSSMVEKAKAAFKDYDNLNFLQMDAASYDFYKNYEGVFDVVTSFVTMHWVKDQKTALQGMSCALKEDGLLYIKTASKTGDPMQDIADELMMSDRYEDYFDNFYDPIIRFSMEEYKALLEDYDFEVLSIQDTQQEDVVKDRDHLIKQIKSWLPHYHHLKNSDMLLADVYLEDVIDTYLERFQNDQNIIILYDHYLDVIAQKRTL